VEKATRLNTLFDARRGEPRAVALPAMSANDDAADAAALTMKAAPSDGRAAVGARTGRIHGLLERAAVVLFPPLFLAALLVLCGQLLEAAPAWLLLPAVLVSFFVGDLVTGLVHWAADTYCSEETPVIGPSLIKPFRMHHFDPKDICRHGVVETLGNTCILACPLLGLLVYAGTSVEWPGAHAFAALVAVLSVGMTVATNQFHKWAHADLPPAPVRLLQASGLILSSEHHEGHHGGGFDSRYCITNGWMNPLLDRLKFFAVAERALGKLGIKSQKTVPGFQNQL
jgi:ubiquitin-conjugating enzyme E2 variant